MYKTYGFIRRTYSFIIYYFIIYYGYPMVTYGFIIYFRGRPTPLALRVADAKLITITIRVPNRHPFTEHARWH